MQVPCPLPIVTLSSSTSSAAAAASKYDPADCLSEHLDYFSSDVVGQSNLMECDFDEIFGSLFHPSSATTVATPAADLTNVPCPLPKEVQTSAAQMPVSPLHSPSVSITSSNADEKSIIVSPAKVTFQTKIEPALLAPKPSVIVSSDEEEGGEDDSIAPVEKKSDLRRKSFKRKNASPTSINIIPDKKRRRKDPTQQEESRRERNRLHAKASRERKRQFFQALEESVQSLKEENERLLQILGLQGNFDRKMVVQRQEEIQATSTEIFVRCLQKPGNRVLHDEELSNLRDHLSS